MQSLVWAKWLSFANLWNSWVWVLYIMATLYASSIELRPRSQKERLNVCFVIYIVADCNS